MAGNSGKGHRDGAVKQRSQFRGANGHYIKRNTQNGQIMDVKSDKSKFKGVTDENK